MANSTLSARPNKPREDFPLFPHLNGRWAKKVRGKFRYFGKWADDPKGEAAQQLWLDQKDDLLAGRTPRVSTDGLTVGTLCNHFLTAKEQQRDAGDIAGRTFADYFSTCKFVVDSFGKTRLVDDLAADDFQSLRARLAKLYGVHRLGNMVQHVRTVFKFGYDSGLIEHPIRFGPTFKRPVKRIMRRHRQKNGVRMFDTKSLRTIIDKADQPLKAMILLGINCGFGNHDVGTLPKSALGLKSGWVDYPRPKTAIERRCPLWPETIAAIKEATEHRPKAKLPKYDGLAFVTKYGQPWAKETPDSPVAKEFRKLLDTIDDDAAKEAKKNGRKAPEKIYRRGLGFYTLRHTFETIAGESRDQVAVDHVMGHSDPSMAAVYREQISDDRLCAVINYVRRWLFADGTER